MATLGSLIVNVLANTSGFAKGMNEVSGVLGSVKRQADVVSGAIGGIKGVVTAVLGGATVYHLKGVAESMDGLAKSADRLGMTTESLIGLQYGAGLAGVSAESLGSSMQFMTRQIGEAVHGSGKAKVVFQEMGINLDKLKQMTPEQQLMKLSESINAVQGQTEKMRASMRLFGGDGAVMLNFLAEGENGIKSYMNEAERLGLTYSRKEVEKIEAFNDAWDSLKQTLGSFSKDLVIMIAPEAVEWIKSLQGIVSSGARPPKASTDGSIMGAIRNAFTGQTWWQKAMEESHVKGGLRKSSIFSSSWSPLSDQYYGNTSFNQAPDFDAIEKKFGLWRGQMAKTAWQPFSQATAERMDVWSHMANRQLEALGLNKGAAYLFGRSKSAMGGLAPALQQALGMAGGGIEKAREFGRQWQNQWLLGKFMPGRHDKAIDELFAKRQTDAQIKGLKYMSDRIGLTGIFNRASRWINGQAEQNRFAASGGLNSAIVFGSVEHMRAKAEDRARERMLDEARKHTSLLGTIAQALKPFSTDV